MEEVSKDTTSKAEGEEEITIDDEPKEKELVYKPKAPFSQRLVPLVKLNNNVEIFKLFN